MIVPGRGGMDGATALVDKAIELAGPTTVNAQRTLIITFTHSASITGLCERFKGGKGVLEGHEDGVVDGGEEVARLEACLKWGKGRKGVDDEMHTLRCSTLPYITHDVCSQL